MDKRLKTSGRDVEGFVKYDNVSSAYKIILWWKCLVCMPVVLVLCRMAATRGAMKMAVSKGVNILALCLT